MNERDIINLLHGEAASERNSLVLGIGDDCAVIEKSPEQYWLVTMDTLVETVHFDPLWHPAEKIGRKAVAVNVSDIAAMGGTPKFIFLSLALPADFDRNWLQQFTKGIKGSCQEYECILAGGDTVKSPAGIVITITVIGEVESKKTLYRKNARPGDKVWVSGFLGQAAAGLELCRTRKKYKNEPALQLLVESHLNPQPRVKLGRMLAQSGLVHSMMDLSDGLASDLAHICEQSGVGAVIDSAKLPLGVPLQQAAQMLGIDSIELMITGGEDYELIFTAPTGSRQHLDTIALESGINLSCIGEITKGQGVQIRKHVTGDDDHRLIDITFAGFDHFQSS